MSITKGYKCQVCNGNGKVWTKIRCDVCSPEVKTTCHGCNGKGWVTAKQVEANEPPLHR